MNHPRVSVIIPTFGRPDTLVRAIQSVLEQTYPYVEAIVVDDNEPGTAERHATEIQMKQFAGDPRVRYIRHEHNKNGAAARNTGARHSKAKYLALLDDDDEFLPNKIEDQVNRMESLPESWAACYCKCRTDFLGIVKEGDNDTREGQLLAEALKREFEIMGGSNLLIRRSVFNEIGGFDEAFKRNQDLEFLVKIFRKYKIAYCDRTGLVRHLHFMQHAIDFDSITQTFTDTFRPLIEQQPEETRKEIYRKLALQKFAFRLYPGKNWKGCLDMLLKKEVSIVAALCYVLSRIRISISRRLPWTLPLKKE